MSGPERKAGIGFTRFRDLIAVLLIAGAVGYLLVRWNYTRMPTLPRAAGTTAALLGIGEAAAGFVLRARLRSSSDRWRPVPPLTAARALMVAKASSLAGAGLAGLWAGLLLYVAPTGDTVRVAADDTTTAVIGVVAALVMAAGALWLEHCCRAPEPQDGPPGAA